MWHLIWHSTTAEMRANERVVWRVRRARECIRYLRMRYNHNINKIHQVRCIVDSLL